MSSTASSAPTTFAALWDELKTDALNLWQSVKNEAIAIEHDLVPVAEADIVAGLAQFKTLALNTVLALAQNVFAGLTGTAKNAITVQTIIQTAAAQGKTIALQDAQLLAQQAYNGLVSTVGTVK